jgi:hypothetical protein
MYETKFLKTNTKCIELGTRKEGFFKLHPQFIPNLLKNSGETQVGRNVMLSKTGL